MTFMRISCYIHENSCYTHENFLLHNRSRRTGTWKLKRTQSHLRSLVVQFAAKLLALILNSQEQKWNPPAIVWEGVVETFVLLGHSIAGHAYGW